MLAGRKLLLADDSATIQKVIDLTFADEGVRVIAVSSGREAIEKLEDFAPDIVLADVHMPSPNGYEICEYVKTNEKLKHVPVMLLVGSFEPFDEAEARRVGADDILTKPFQSIRRLIDRVGALVSSPPAEKEKEGPTAELPRTEEPVEEPRLNTKELEITTADTLPLEGHPFADTLPRIEPVVVSETVSESVDSTPSPSARLEALLSETQPSSEGTLEHEGTMEPVIPETNSESRGESSDVLLDLGELETARAVESDDFVLDLDDDQAPVYESTPMRAFVEPEVRETAVAASGYESSYQPEASYQPSYQPATHEPDTYSPFAETQEVPYASEAAYTEASAYETPSVPPELTPDPVPVFGETEFPVAADTPHKADTPHAAATAAAQSFTADQLSPEMIDAIARRAVELMSDKVIREIAWEVVPDLAELLIKRQLEERQAK